MCSLQVQQGHNETLIVRKQITAYVVEVGKKTVADGEHLWSVELSCSSTFANAIDVSFILITIMLGQSYRGWPVHHTEKGNNQKQVNMVRVQSKQVHAQNK